MVDPPKDVAVRMRRQARAKSDGIVRFYAGWRLFLTYGVFDGMKDAETLRRAEALYGKPIGDLDELRAAIDRSQYDLWHLSASWRGNFDVTEGARLRAELLVPLGIPKELREGFQPIRVANVVTGDSSSPVTHWLWRDADA